MPGKKKKKGVKGFYFLCWVGCIGPHFKFKICSFPNITPENDDFGREISTSKCLCSKVNIDAFLIVNM